MDSGDVYTVTGTDGEYVELDGHNEFPLDYTHKKPVFDADGVPIKVGDTVYAKCDEPNNADVKKGEELTITRVDNAWVTASNSENYRWLIESEHLTHTKPERKLPELTDMFGILRDREDSWERIERDALNFVEDNAGIPHDQDQMERDILYLVRRCKKLAGVSE